MDRAQSMFIERVRKDAWAPLYTSLSPKLLRKCRTRRKNFQITVPPDIPAGDKLASPTEKITYFDICEETVPEEVIVTICKNVLQQNLRALLKTNSGNISFLDEIESGKITAENVNMFCDKSDEEKNIALLWSALHRRSELLPGLLACGADLMCCDTDGFSALHLAAFSGDMAACKYLITQGADVNLIYKRNTPLHTAALGGAPQVVQLLLDNGAKVDGMGGEGTALHSAVKANSVECLQLLMPCTSDINSIELSGFTPLHLAADLGNIPCLKLLLDFKGINPNMKTCNEQASALHIAAENGYHECVSILLRNGASADEVNHCGQTALHLATRSQCIECVEALLEVSDVNATDFDNHTPLHTAINGDSEAYDVVKILLKHGAEVNVKDINGCSPVHLAACSELASCVEMLMDSGADVCTKTNGGVTALSIILRKVPESLRALYQKLDKSVHPLDDDDETNREQKIQLDFRILLQHCEQGEISYLKTFVDEEYSKILQHPLCRAFLHFKWEKIRRFYVVRLIFCFLFVLLLTVFMYFLSHVHYETKQTENTTNSSGIMNGSDNSSYPIQNTSRPQVCFKSSKKIWGPYCTQHDTIIAPWFFLAIVVFLELYRKLHSMRGYSSARQYVRVPENVIEWFVILSVITLLVVSADSILSFDPHSTQSSGLDHEWVRGLAAITVLLAWTNFMFKIGQLPVFDCYVAMFASVQKEFLKLFFAYGSLLIGFTFTFCIILPKSEEFIFPHTGLLKILVMMTGELNLINFLQTEGGNTNVMFIVMFAIFILFVTVVLMNLLVGIAVNDIQGLHKTAELSKLERQILLISQIEIPLFGSFHFPKRFLKKIRDAAMVSPSSYRVALFVYKHNKHLPKPLLKALYELASKEKRSRTTVSSEFQLKSSPDTCRDDIIGKLTLEVAELKASVADLIKTIQDLGSHYSYISCRGSRPRILMPWFSTSRAAWNSIRRWDATWLSWSFTGSTLNARLITLLEHNEEQFLTNKSKMNLPNLVNFVSNKYSTQKL